MAASPPDGRRSLHLQPREAGTELPRDAIVLRWEALRELGLALGDKVQVRCTGEAHTETWAMLAWASGRIPAGCVLVPPALGLLSCTGCVELWPAGLTLEGSPLPCTSTSLPIASRSSHSLSAGVHKARRLCGATSNADVGVTTAGPLPLVLLLAGDLGAAVGPELETLAQLLTCADLPLRSPNAFALWGLPAPQGILLHGPAGSGKTRMGRLLGEYLCVHTARISAGELLSVGGFAAEEALVSAFTTARAAAPALLLIDDIELIGVARGATAAACGGDARLLATLLVQLNAPSCGLLVLATTTDPDKLDAALRRPGRFDSEIEIRVPDATDRHALLRAILPPAFVLSEASLARLSACTSGFVTADIAALKRHAVALALAQQRRVEETKCSGTNADAAGCRTRGHGVAEAGKRGCARRPGLEDLEAALPDIRPTALRGETLQVSNVSWADIGGQPELKQALVEAVVWPLRHGPAFARLGIRPPRGVLLYGPPGCSKTLAAKALAADAHTSFLAVKGPELLSKWVGESERQVAALFHKARAAAPSIVFFDEIDALAPARSGGAHVGSRVLSQLLHEMDGVRKLQAVVVIAATNRPDLIDAALLRPGRFDRLIYVGLPNESARLEILVLHTARMPLANDVSLHQLAADTAGYSGAELAAICREAAQTALYERLDSVQVAGAHFASALTVIRPRTSPGMLAFFERFSVAAAPIAAAGDSCEKARCQSSEGR
mmetsp:Transcript_5479/g.17254  ORF Transcript_5479/g.17254 Transcript_5479/m.17254 type:complete len:728 (+) Transcript_5479:82-2265(+)